MKKSKLLALVLALVISIGAITSSTIAWFTDSVISANNIITSGVLDVEVYRGNANDKNSIQNDKTLFNDVTLWEPGAAAWENLTVVNEGNLAFKYEMTINAINENKMTDETEACLSQILKVGFVDGAIADNATREEVIGSVKDWKSFSAFKTNGMLLPVNHTIEDRYIPAGAVVGEKAYGMVIYWEPTDKDNNWNVHNGKTTDDGMEYLHIDLGVKLTASQLPAEADSFDNKYDTGSIVANGKTVKETLDEFAASSEKIKETVYVGKDETITDATLTIKNCDNITIDLYGNILTVENTVAKQDCIVVNSCATLTITDSIGGGELRLVNEAEGYNEIYLSNSHDETTATLNITKDAKIVLSGENTNTESDMILAYATKGKAVVNLLDNACIEVGGSQKNHGVRLVNATMTVAGNASVKVVGTGDASTGINAINESSVTLRDNASVEVGGNAELYGIYILGASVTLEGNAKVDVVGKGDHAAGINVNTDAALTLKDSACINVKGDAAYLYGLNVVGAGKVDIKDDVHIYVEGDQYQTGIIMAEGTVNMSGGSITGLYNRTSQSGRINGVYLTQSSSVFNMSGGAISVDGHHCTTGIHSGESDGSGFIGGTVNITGGKFYVNSKEASVGGYNAAISAMQLTKLKVSGAEFYVNALSDGSSKVLGMAALIAADASVDIGDNVKVYATNSANGSKVNQAFCDYESNQDFSLVSMNDMNSYNGNSSAFNQRLNGTVPFKVKGTQLNATNYSSLFDGMIEWKTAN